MSEDPRGDGAHWIRAAAVLLLLLAAACRNEALPPQAIFHPGGTQALHASDLDADDLVIRESVYLPVYSNIHWGGRSLVTELAATVSIRNADLERSLVLISATYYDSLGQPIQEVLGGVKELDPMSTVEFVVDRTDGRGGSGANFLVEWGSTGSIAVPVMETIMLGQSGNAGISFVSVGRPIQLREAPERSATRD